MKARLGTVLLVLLLTAAARAQTPSDRYVIVRNERVGYINSQGREVIPPRFGSAADKEVTSQFHEGLAAVEQDGKWGYIDVQGRWVIKPRYWWAHPFHEGIAAVLLPGVGEGVGYIDRRGKLLFRGKSVDERAYFSQGLLPIRLAGKWGYVDADFDLAIPPQFDWAFPFSEERAAVRVGEKFGFIDKTGKTIVDARYDEVGAYHEGLVWVRTEEQSGTAATAEGEKPTFTSRYLFLNLAGNAAFEANFASATDFAEGFALATPQGSSLMAVIDRRGSMVRSPSFDDAREFHEGLAAARVDNRWGFIDHTGEWVVKPAFVHAASFWHGLARVVFEKGYGYINRAGEVVWRSES